MNYFLSEANTDPNKRTAESKPRLDAEKIMLEMGFEKIQISKISGGKSRLGKNVGKYRDLLSQTNHLQFGDTILIQHPVRNSYLIRTFLKRMKKRGVKSIALIHDLNYIRFEERDKFTERWLCYYKDVITLKGYSKVIAHNEQMKAKLVSWGVAAENIVSLGIFDYLTDQEIDFNRSEFSEVTIAGNLMPAKSRYCYDLPTNSEFILYGVNYEAELQKNQTSVKYLGSFASDDISAIKGKYGLVWDGNSTETCSGEFGRYLRFNNSFKLSMYIVAQMPLIVWQESALKDFVEEHKIGFYVSSLSEIYDKLAKISAADYQIMQANLVELSQQVRNGYFLKNAIDKCLV